MRPAFAVLALLSSSAALAAPTPGRVKALNTAYKQALNPGQKAEALNDAIHELRERTVVINDTETSGFARRGLITGTLRAWDRSHVEASGAEYNRLYQDLVGEAVGLSGRQPHELLRVVKRAYDAAAPGSPNRLGAVWSAFDLVNMAARDYNTAGTPADLNKAQRRLAATLRAWGSAPGADLTASFNGLVRTLGSDRQDLMYPETLLRAAIPAAGRGLRVTTGRAIDLLGHGGRGGGARSSSGGNGNSPLNGPARIIPGGGIVMD